MSSRRLRSGGVTTTVALDRSKKYKYNSTGTLVEATTIADNDIIISGSKSALRRIEDLERNVSILAAVGLTNDGDDNDGANQSSLNTWTARQTFTGGITMGSNIVPSSNNSRDIGSSTYKFANVYATTFNGQATTAKYADLAENYVADKQYDAGTVVEFGGAEEITVAAPGSTRVAGVVSTAPGFLMNAGLKGTNVVAVAFTGRVPCKVTGSVRKGDILVASGNGHATVARDPKVGQIIGKALANFDGQSGVIEVAVGRF
jgi:hypothetical protein